MLTNYEICYSCRSPDHFFEECPYKKKCPKCPIGTQKWLVTKQGLHKGRLFFNCTDCKYFKWDKGEGSSIGGRDASEDRQIANEGVCQLVDLFARAIMAEGGKITLQLTIPYDKNERARTVAKF